jgi:hypothetical protein
MNPITFEISESNPGAPKQIFARRTYAYARRPSTGCRRNHTGCGRFAGPYLGTQYPRYNS